MTLPMAGRSLAELCADSRTVPVLGGGMHLHLGTRAALDDDPLLAEADQRPRPAGITPISFGADGLTSPLTTRFLDRLPAEALDLAVYLPSTRELDGPIAPVTLGGHADRLGIPVQVPVSALDGSGDPLPGASHRMVWLGGDDRPTTKEQALTVRVLPTSARSFDAYADPPAAVADLIAGRPYLPGRIVSGPDGTRIGRPAGLAAPTYGPVLSGLGRPLDHDDAGDTPVTPVDGYADLVRRLDTAPPGTQSLVLVDDKTYLAHVDDGGLWLLDPGIAGAALLPARPGSVGLVPLPGRMPLDERLDALNVARFGTPDAPATWPMTLPPGARFLDSAGGRDIVLVGADEPETVLGSLRASGPGQPVIVLGVGRGGETPGAEAAADVRFLIERYGWRGQVPVVVTRAGVKTGDDLLDLLDGYGASLVHRVADAPTGSSGGLAVNFGPSLRWTNRQSGEPLGANPSQPELTPELVDDAGQGRRRPAYGRLPQEAGTFLSKPLAAQAASLLDLAGGALKTLRPLIGQVATRDPAAAGHAAFLDLAGMGKGKEALAYVTAGDGRGAGIFGPLQDLGGASAQERLELVATLVPRLAELAGGEAGDYAGRGIMSALGGMIGGSMTPAEAQDRIWQYKDYLPKEGRVDWVRNINDLKNALPGEQSGALDQVREMVMTCP